MSRTKTELIKSYQDRLIKHGPSPQAVQYTDKASHIKRFAILSDIDPKMTSVLDVGCGMGDFCHYMRQCGSEVNYHGVDIVPEFVELANEAFSGDPFAIATHLDAELAALPQGFEYSILSGVFNNVMEDNWEFMQRTLHQMWNAATKGIAFNAMSTYVDYRDADLYYVNPLQVFAFCKSQLGGHPVLRHDYTVKDGGFPFEFAIYVYKSPN